MLAFDACQNSSLLTQERHLQMRRKRYQRGSLKPRKTGAREVRLSRLQSSMERAGAMLRRDHKALIVSRRTIKKAKGIELVRIKREHVDQALCFCSRPFRALRTTGSSAAGRAARLSLTQWEPVSPTEPSTSSSFREAR